MLNSSSPAISAVGSISRFEESCGFFHVGPTPEGESAMKGAHGQRILHTPGRDDRAHAHEQTREQLLRHRPGRLARTQ